MKKIIVLWFFTLLFAISCTNSTVKLPVANEDSNDEDISEIADEDSEEEKHQESDSDIEIRPLEFESGYIELESVSYTLNFVEEKTGRAKMWYNFQPADENPEEKPLFVLFNGGPGSASALIFLYNTAKKTGDQFFSGEDVADNESNWNKMGNLLYVDARQTGFSFGIIDDPERSEDREAYFSSSNFNVFADAADFIRVILRFLQKHPQIQSNPVILSGESYGGTRTTAILNILLNVADYNEKNRVFYDETLFMEIAEHFRTIGASFTDMPSKETVLQQFDHQIMIQPLVAGSTQMNAAGELLEKSDSPVFIVEQETGVDFTPCSNQWSCSKYNNAISFIQSAGRDIYSYRRPYNWLFDYTDVATAKMLQFSKFTQFIMNDPKEISDLYAQNRSGVFRYGSSVNTKSPSEYSDFRFMPEPVKIIMQNRFLQRQQVPLLSGDLESIFGELPSYDEYFVDLNYSINFAFYRASVSPYDDVNGDMFLENIRSVRTFITQAEEDIVIYSKGIPESLKNFKGVSDVKTASDSFTVHFSDGQSVEVTFPFYPESAHSVSVNQPAKLLQDIQNWL